MFRKILIDLLYIGLYFVIYRLGGFEIAVIIALGQIMSNLVQKDNNTKKIKPTPPTHKQVYVQPTTKMRF